MSAHDLSGLHLAAHLISVVGKGGAYIALCLALSLAALWRRRAQGRALFEARLEPHFDLLAWRLWVYWVVGTLINQALKFSLAQPRPWWSDPSTSPLSPHPSDGFGMPSGHAQGSVGLALLAYSLWRMGVLQHLWGRVAVVASLAWVPLTMWARVDLHAHSVAQVSAGLCVGVVWAWALTRLEESARGWLALLALTLLSALTLGLHLTHPVETPEAWRAAIEAATGEQAFMLPKLKVVGALCIASSGLSWALWRHHRA